MHDRLAAVQHQFQKLELKKQEIMDLLESIPPDQYFLQPHPNTWSVAQVARHLYMSERNSLAYLKKKLSYPDTVPRYHPKSWGGIFLIKLVFATGYKIKAPESIDMWKVTDQMSHEELKMKWGVQRHELISFIEKNDLEFGRRLAFRHPFAGRMTMYQMLIFMNDHLAHHQKQMKKILGHIQHQPKVP